MPFKKGDPASRAAQLRGAKKAGTTQRASQRVRGNPAEESEHREAGRIVKRNQQDKTP